MNIDSIPALEKAMKAENLLAKHHLDRIGVFGSFARGEAANDIDFYIEADNLTLSNIVDLKKDLEKLIDKKVDIMLKKYANPIVLYRAQKDMRYVVQ